jgi:hypothetical protein
MFDFKFTVLLLLSTIIDNWDLTTWKSVVLQNWPLESISLSLCCWRKHTVNYLDTNRFLYFKNIYSKHNGSLKHKHITVIKRFITLNQQNAQTWTSESKLYLYYSTVELLSIMHRMNKIKFTSAQQASN